jgi:phage terminase small subunit
MSEHETLDNNLTPKQRKAIESLLATGNVAEAARAAGVARQSLYRWLADPDFAKALRAAEQIALEGLARSLLRLGDKATAAIEAALDDQAAPHTVKLKAASVVFTHHPQLLESVMLADRVAALEDALDGKS